PFLTEYFYYGEVAFGIALSVLFAALAVYLTAASLRLGTSIMASAAAIVAALATYQIAIGFILAGFVIVSVVDACADAGPILVRKIGVRAAAFALGMVAYGLCLVALRAIHPAVGSGRAFNPGGAGIGERLDGLGQAIMYAVAPPAGIVTAPVAAVCGMLVGCGVIVLVIGVGRQHGRFAGVAAGVLLGCALAAACAPAVLGRTPWLAARLLSASSLVFAGLAVACLPAAQSWRRRAWIACTGILLLGYVAADTSILFDQR